jgi:hypothetical protein
MEWIIVGFGLVFVFTVIAFIILFYAMNQD